MGLLDGSVQPDPVMLMVIADGWSGEGRSVGDDEAVAQAFRQRALEGIGLALTAVREHAQRRPAVRIHARGLRGIAEQACRQGMPAIALVAERLGDILQAIGECRMAWNDRSRATLVMALERLRSWLQADDFGRAEDPTALLTLLPLARQSAGSLSPEAHREAARHCCWSLIEQDLVHLGRTGDRDAGLERFRRRLTGLVDHAQHLGDEEVQAVLAILQAAVGPLEGRHLADPHLLAALLKRLDLCLTGVARSLAGRPGSGGRSTKALLALGAVRRVLDLSNALRGADLAPDPA